MGYPMYNPKLHKIIQAVLTLPAFELLPLDIRRYIIIPMVLYPYIVVGCAGNRYLLRDIRSDKCWIGGISLGKNIRFATRMRYGWIVQDDSSIYAVGAHGIYARYRMTLQLLDTYWNYAAERRGDIMHYEYPEALVWCAGMGKNRDNWIHGQVCISAPPEFDRVVLIIGPHYDISRVILWDGGRRLYDCICLTECRLPWVPVSFTEILDEDACLATAPWGEIVTIPFFESIQ